jgi:hypothetical protein
VAVRGHLTHKLFLSHTFWVSDEQHGLFVSDRTHLPIVARLPVRDAVVVPPPDEVLVLDVTPTRELPNSLPQWIPMAKRLLEAGSSGHRCTVVGSDAWWRGKESAAPAWVGAQEKGFVRGPVP